MSITLFFLVPIGVLAVIWSLCFVGCVLNTHGQGNLTYSDTFVLGEPSLIAYWPLSDLPGPPPAPPFPAPLQGSTSVGTAADLSGNGHIGSYLVPPAYPTLPQSKAIPNPGANLQQFLRQPSIVPGDSGSTANPSPASAEFEGEYVSIPWSTQNRPKLDNFTLEANILPKWMPTDTGFFRVVFSAFINGTGFRVLINDQNQLAAVIGDGTPNGMEFSAPTAIDFTNPTYLAVTFESASQTLSLWVNPNSGTSAPPTALLSKTVTYVAIDLNQPVTFFIGAGANELPPRTQDGALGAPEFPFQGRIQSVALYSAALKGTDLQSHFLAGGG